MTRPPKLDLIAAVPDAAGVQEEKAMRVQTRNGRRRLVAVVVALGVTLTSVLFGWVAPAQAVPSPSLAVAVSAFNSVSPKAAVATCPGALVVYGAGGTIGGGGGSVVLSDVIPTMTTVTAWGIETAPFAGNWSVTAYAICGPANGNVIVTYATGASPVTPKSGIALCPAGTSLYGTGYELDGANGQVFPSIVRPDVALSNVTVGAFATGGFAGNWNLIAYGICANPAANMQLVTAQSGLNPGSPKTVTTAACPGNLNVHGVGAEISGGLGDVLLDGMAPNAILTTSQSDADEFVPVAANWAIISYAICSS